MNESSNDCPRVQSIFIHVHPWVLTKHCLLRFLQEMDFGTIMCWADNNVGQQKEPCVFHLIAAGKPEAPTNCTVVNQTSDSLEVYCIEGELYGPHRAHTYTYIYVKLPANLLPFFIRFGSVAFFSHFVSIIADEPINGRKRHWSMAEEGQRRWEAQVGVVMSWDFLCSMNTSVREL